MNEVKYNFFHWGPFLFHSTMSKELCELMLEEGRKVRGKSDKFYNHKLAGHLGEQYKLDRDKIITKLAMFLEGYCIGYNQWRGGGGMKPKAKLLSLWINYMKAGDFNPPHSTKLVRNAQPLKARCVDLVVSPGPMVKEIEPVYRWFINCRQQEIFIFFLQP